ncbi:MAG TPA: (2Fe-2S)-binding protein, partial [Methylomirabilota bacterium]|nr:(2Fe-2S)-binding protein [Methylomirabilota bacterium]
LHGQHFGALAGALARVQVTVPNLAEHRLRPCNEAGYGEMVCHCELVTRTEIESALAGPLPAVDLGGLKRRTRCMMGRCQGFYCSARVAELAAGRLPDLALRSAA